MDRAKSHDLDACHQLTPEPGLALVRDGWLAPSNSEDSYPLAVLSSDAYFCARWRRSMRILSPGPKRRIYTVDYLPFVSFRAGFTRTPQASAHSYRGERALPAAPSGHANHAFRYASVEVHPRQARIMNTHPWSKEDRDARAGLESQIRAKLGHAATRDVSRRVEDQNLKVPARDGISDEKDGTSTNEAAGH